MKFHLSIILLLVSSTSLIMPFVTNILVPPMCYSFISMFIAFCGAFLAFIACFIHRPNPQPKYREVDVAQGNYVLKMRNRKKIAIYLEGNWGWNYETNKDTINTSSGRLITFLNNKNSWGEIVGEYIIRIQDVVAVECTMEPHVIKLVSYDNGKSWEKK